MQGRQMGWSCMLVPTGWFIRASLILEGTVCRRCLLGISALLWLGWLGLPFLGRSGKELLLLE